MRIDRWFKNIDSYAWWMAIPQRVLYWYHNMPPISDKEK